MTGRQAVGTRVERKNGNLWWIWPLQGPLPLDPCHPRQFPNRGGTSIPSFRLFYLKKEKPISLNSIHPNRCASTHFLNLHLTLSLLFFHSIISTIPLRISYSWRNRFIPSFPNWQRFRRNERRGCSSNPIDLLHCRINFERFVSRIETDGIKGGPLLSSPPQAGQFRRAIPDYKETRNSTEVYDLLCEFKSVVVGQMTA